MQIIIMNSCQLGTSYLCMSVFLFINGVFSLYTAGVPVW